MDLVRPEDISPLRRAVITIGLMLAAGLQFVDGTVAAVALTQIKGSLGVTQDQVTWVVTSYLVTASICLPLTGWLSGRFGRRQLFLFAIGGFISASLLCAHAGSLAEMIVYRIILGCCGAFMIPLSQASMLDIYPKERHGLAMSLWGAAATIGPIVGPPLGGYITEAFDWRWNFYLSIPLGLTSFLVLLGYLPHYARDRSRRFDIFGFAMLGVAVGCFQFLAGQGERLDWFASPTIVATAILSAAGLYLFVIHSTFAKQPFINLALLRDRNYAVALVIIVLVGFMQFTAVVVMPAYLQAVQGYSIYEAGWAIVPRGFGMLFSALGAGWLMNRINPNLHMIMGMLILASGNYAMTQVGNQIDLFYLHAASFGQGFGTGFVSVPLGVMAFATLAPQYRPEAAGFLNLLRGLGSSLGAAILLSLLTRNIQINRSTLVEYVSPFNELLRDPGLGLRWALDVPSGLASLDAQVMHQATLIAYQNDFLVMMAAPLLGIPLTLLLRRGRQ